MCETCNFTAHAFPVLQREILKASYCFPPGEKKRKKGVWEKNAQGKNSFPFSSLPGARPLDAYR